MSIDYKEISSSLIDDKVIQLMVSLGADKYEEREKFIIFPTICHNVNSSEASMKLYYYRDTKLFMCYTEDGGMNIFRFLETYYKTRDITYDWYQDIYSVIINCAASPIIDGFESTKYESMAERYKRKEKLKELPIYPNVILDVFVNRYPPEWLNDGITREAMNKFGIKFSISQNKIIIPHHNTKGELVGIRGRALNKWDIENFGKYMPVQIERKWYSHPLSLNVYGLNQTKEAIKKNGIVYLFEAEKSVLQMEAFSIPNCAVAVCGSNFNKFQFQILFRECHPKEIIICFDNEELNGEEKYFNKLLRIAEKYKDYTNISFIYDRQHLTNLKDSPTDQGEETFLKLLEGRVKV